MRLAAGPQDFGFERVGRPSGRSSRFWGSLRKPRRSSAARGRFEYEIRCVVLQGTVPASTRRLSTYKSVRCWIVDLDRSNPFSNIQGISARVDDFFISMILIS